VGSRAVDRSNFPGGAAADERGKTCGFIRVMAKPSGAWMAAGGRVERAFQFDRKKFKQSGMAYALQCLMTVKLHK
jgi:hypothetical protein